MASLGTKKPPYQVMVFETHGGIRHLPDFELSGGWEE